MILHTLNYTTLDISSQFLNLDDFKIIGKFKVVGNSSNISGHPSEGFSIPFLFENYDSFQIIHYPERYYFRIKDNMNNWLAWQRHKHKIADIDGLQSILDSFNSRISALESNSVGLPPGVILAVAWNPGFYTGKRVLPLHGQGIPISSYPELVNATYVGDGLNGTAHFFYKYNSWNGARNIYGDYFRLPDTKALVPKGRGDLSFGIRYFDWKVKYNTSIMGNLQEDTIQDHTHHRVFGGATEETLIAPLTSIAGHYPVGSNGFHIYQHYETGVTYQGRRALQTRDCSFAVDFVITY